LFDKLGSVDNVVAFAAWQSDNYHANQEAELSSIPTATELINKLCQTDYHQDSEVGELTEMLDSPAFHYIGLGIRNGCGYRLAPNPRVLAATREIHWDDAQEIMPPMFLGINKNVRPVRAGEKRKRSRKDNWSDESNVCSTSDGRNDDSGFLFFQLGHLEYCPAEYWNPDNPHHDNWIATGFAVVVKIDSKGHPQDTHILFNFHPKDEDGDRMDIDSEKEDWGRLPGEKVQRAGALIATHFNKLAHNLSMYVADPTDSNVNEGDVVKQESEFVCAVKIGYPGATRIVRQFTSNNPW
jgi:hypothetical protein